MNAFSPTANWWANAPLKVAYFTLWTIPSTTFKYVVLPTKLVIWDVVAKALVWNTVIPTAGVFKNIGVKIYQSLLPSVVKNPVDWLTAKVVLVGRVVLAGGTLGALYYGYLKFNEYYEYVAPLANPLLKILNEQVGTPLLQEATRFATKEMLQPVVKSVAPAAAVMGQAVQTYVNEKTVQATKVWKELSPATTVGYLATATSWVAGHGLDATVSIARNSSWHVWGFLGAYTGVIVTALYGKKVADHLIDYIAMVWKASVGATQINVGDSGREIPIVTPMLRTLGKITNKLFPTTPAPPAMFNQRITTRTDNYVKALQNAYKRKGKLQNMLLVGPPGTGKTMVSWEIAHKTGFRRFDISGPNITQFIDNDRKHIHHFNKLMKRIKSCPGPKIVFVDECDSFLQHRLRPDGTPNLDSAHAELLNRFLDETGSGSKDIAWVLTTNLKDNLDPAVKSRMSQEIYIGAPTYEVRANMMKAYFGHLFDKTPERLSCLSDSALERMAAMVQGLTGRSIMQLTEILKGDKDAADDGLLTATQIDERLWEAIWKDRETRGSERSWRPIEMARDFWYFKIGRIVRAINVAINYLKGLMEGPARILKDWVWQPPEEMDLGVKGFFGNLKRFQLERTKLKEKELAQRLAASAA